jgi:glucose-1-phosphate thymidylyltransferase
MDGIYTIENSVIIHPVTIGDNVRIINSVIGPYASVAEDTVIENSIILNSVIGSRTHISMINLQSSVIGDDANLVGRHNSLNIGDSSSIEY